MQAAALAEGYRVTVSRLVPNELVGRDDELAALANFCRGDRPYLWWQAGPWAGKTGLLAWFAMHPPDNVDVVCFFIRAGVAIENSLDGYLYNVLPQLAVLTGDTLPAGWEGPAKQNLYQQQLNAAAQQAADNRRPLTLIIDGLDEDVGSPSIVSQLPKPDYPALRIILASRDKARVPTDIEASHPLGDWPKTVLTPSPYARGIGDKAERELQGLLTGKNRKVHRRLVGFITAARGGLTVKDLAALCNQPQSEVKSFLASEAGRSLSPHAFSNAVFQPGDVGYVLAHQELTRLAVDELGRELADYREKIHAWAQQYGADQWPATSPTYLLLEYPELLKELQDSDRLYALATDTRRHERLFERTAGDAAAINEISVALELLADEPYPDLAKICLLARQRHQLTIRNDNVPNELLTAWVHLGKINRAVAAAQSKADGLTRSGALATVCSALARTGFVDWAEELALTITDEDRQADELSQIAQIVAYSGDVDRAVTIASTITDVARPWRSFAEINQAQALIAIANTVARNGDIDRAITMAHTIVDDSYRADALQAIAQTVALSGEIDRAETIASTITKRFQKARALATIGPIIAQTGDLQHGTELIDRAERLANAEGNSWAVAAIAEAAAKIGDIDRAETIAHAISDDSHQANALSTVVEIVARTGDIDQARKIAQTIREGSYRARALSGIANVVAGVGDVDRAEAIALTITDGRRRAEALGLIAKTVARSGDIDRAECVANTIPAESYRAEALSAIANVVAGVGDVDRAEAIALTITDDRRRAEALSLIAKTVVVSGDIDRAQQLTVLADAGLNRLISQDDYETRALITLAGIAVQSGEIDYAQAVARAITDNHERSTALATIAHTIAHAGEIDRAETIIDTIIDGYEKAGVLALIARLAFRAGDTDRSRELSSRAERLADTITAAEGSSWALPLAAIGSAAVEVGDLHRGIELFNRAVGLAHTITIDHRRGRALVMIANTVAQTGEIDRAQAIIQSITDDGYEVVAAKVIAETAARCGEIDSAETIARTIVDGHYRAEALRAIVETVARSGEIDRAETLVDTLSSDYDRAEALRVIGQIVAQAGDPHHATELFNLAETIAYTLPASYYGVGQGQTLSGIVEAVAQGGHVDRAEAIADTITEDSFRARAMAAIGKIEAEAGNITHAVELADRAEALIGILWDEKTLCSVIEVMARAGYDDRVDDIARSISKRPTASQLVSVAERLAAIGLENMAVRVLAKAWIGLPWVEPLKVLGAVDPLAAYRVAEKISRNLDV